MKVSIMKSAAILTLVMGGLLISACGENKSEPYEEQYADTLSQSTSTEDANEARRQLLSDRIREMELELDQAISELDAKIEHATEAEKVKWQLRRDKLSMQRDQLKLDMERMGTEISNDWQQLENDLADRLDKIAEDLREEN